MNFIKPFFRILTTLSLILGISFELFIQNSFAEDLYPQVVPQESYVGEPPQFQKNVVCLLVGLNASELSYREISSLSGFELFSVPYRSDIKLLVEQIKPTQVIIKHPSGFVGLYAIDGQLIRGVQTTNNSEVIADAQAYPPSIIQPTQAHPNLENVFYPGLATGNVPHGGVGYVPQPKGRKGFLRNLVKIISFGSFVPFQYPYSYANNGSIYNQKNLFPSLLVPAIPQGIVAASSYADSKFEAQDYDQVKTQPRDYMFQPVIEGY